MTSSAGGTMSAARPLSEAAAGERAPRMTTQVIRGGLWNLGGQGVTMLLALVTMPIVIRLLGAEGYGVLALVNLLVGYLAFSDLGMGTATTRFGAEAHARGDDQAETAVVWTGLLISAVPALVGATALTLAARPLLDRALHVPAYLQNEAVFALRLASLGFIARTLAGVLNTPQLVRLRIRLNTGITAASGVAQLTLTPAVLFLGGGLAGAVTVSAGVSVATAACHGFFSRRLLPSLLHPRVDWRLLGRMARFGGALLVSTVIGLLLMNTEKVLLARFGSVKALAHYTVAYTLANLLTVPANALAQSLLPLFARLQAAGQWEELERLYNDILRGIFLLMPLVAVGLCLGAQKFFTWWAGAEYGSASTLPFYILMAGLCANVAAYVPYCLFTALGRADFHARYHLLELPPYLLLAWLLTARWGSAGAAAAWSLRQVFGFPFYLVAARRRFALPCTAMAGAQARYGGALALLALPLLGTLSSGMAWSLWLPLDLVAVAGYLWLVWTKLLREGERDWIRQTASLQLRRVSVAVKMLCAK